MKEKKAHSKARPGRAESPRDNPIVNAIGKKPGDKRYGDYDNARRSESKLTSDLSELDRRISNLENAKELFDQNNENGEIDPDEEFIFQGQLNSLIRQRTNLTRELDSTVDTAKPFSSEVSNLIRAQKNLKDAIARVEQTYSPDEINEILPMLQAKLDQLYSKTKDLERYYQPSSEVEFEQDEPESFNSLVNEWQRFKDQRP